jgi:hypothetical protein
MPTCTQAQKYLDISDFVVYAESLFIECFLGGFVFVLFCGIQNNVLKKYQIKNVSLWRSI